MRFGMRRFAQIAAFILAIAVMVGLTILINQNPGSHPWVNIVGEVLGVLVSLYALFTAIVVFFENRNPNKTVSWLLVLLLLPVVGFVLYVLFGQNFRKKRLFRKRKPSIPQVEGALGVQKRILEFIEIFEDDGSPVNKRLINLLLNNSDSPFYINNSLRILTNGDETYQAMFDAISEAFHHIHLEMFIIRDDEVGNRLKALLIRKAQEGIHVRVVYDSVGCWKLSNRYIQELRNAGVQIHPFFPVIFPIVRRELNYRNHRKILVVDGQAGFVGGLNIGDEYLGKNPRLGFWRDTHMLIEGESVYSLQAIFQADWEFSGGEPFSGNDYFPVMGRKDNRIVQIAASGPDSDWESILQGYFTLIAMAEKRIWIATPYLVPEESLLMGMKTAALSGVDVRILIPSKPDHFFVFWASRDHIENLLEAGVRIYTYQKGFIHSKILMVDGIGASIGTANLDIRSMEINFEVNAFVYDSDVVERLECDFKKDLSDSLEIKLEEYRKRGYKERFLESLGRLVSPLQ